MFALISILFSLFNKPKSLDFNNLRFCSVNILGVLWQSNFFYYFFLLWRRSQGLWGLLVLFSFITISCIFMISVLTYKSILLLQSWLHFINRRKKAMCMHHIQSAILICNFAVWCCQNFHFFHPLKNRVKVWPLKSVLNFISYTLSTLCYVVSKDGHWLP